MRIFFRSLLWKTGRAPRGKTHKSIGLLLHAWNSGFPGLSTLSFQQFIHYSSGLLPLALVPRDFCSWVSALVNCDSLYLPFCLFNFWGISLLYELSSPMDLIRVYFSVCFAFCLLLHEMAFISSLHPGPEIWSKLCIFGRVLCN